MVHRQDVTGCDSLPIALRRCPWHRHVAQKCLEVSPESQWSSDRGHCCSLHVPTSSANSVQLIWKQSNTFRLASPLPSKPKIHSGSWCKLVDFFQFINQTEASKIASRSPVRQAASADLQQQFQRNSRSTLPRLSTSITRNCMILLKKSSDLIQSSSHSARLF